MAHGERRAGHVPPDRAAGLQRRPLDVQVGYAGPSRDGDEADNEGESTVEEGGKVGLKEGFACGAVLWSIEETKEEVLIPGVEE